MTRIPDDAARRAYWAEQMELSYELLHITLAFAVRDCGECFASVHGAAFATSACSGLSLDPQDVHNARAMQLPNNPSP